MGERVKDVYVMRDMKDVYVMGERGTYHEPPAPETRFLPAPPSLENRKRVFISNLQIR